MNVSFARRSISLMEAFPGKQLTPSDKEIGGRKQNTKAVMFSQMKNITTFLSKIVLHNAYKFSMSKRDGGICVLTCVVIISNHYHVAFISCPPL